MSKNLFIVCLFVVGLSGYGQPMEGMYIPSVQPSTSGVVSSAAHYGSLHHVKQYLLRRSAAELPIWAAFIIKYEQGSSPLDNYVGDNVWRKALKGPFLASLLANVLMPALQEEVHYSMAAGTALPIDGFTHDALAVLKGKPDRPVALRMLFATAAIYTASGYGQAAAHTNRATRKLARQYNAPAFVAAAYTQDAMLALEQGNTAVAINACRSALAVADSTNDVSWYALLWQITGDAYQAMDDYSQAEDAYRKSLHSGQSMQQLSGQCRALDQLASLAIARQQWDSATFWLDSLASLLPVLVTGTATIKQQYHLRRAELHFNLGDSIGGLWHYRQQLPYDSTVRYNYSGLQHAGEQRYNSTIAAAELHKAKHALQALKQNSIVSVLFIAAMLVFTGFQVIWYYRYNAKSANDLSRLQQDLSEYKDWLQTQKAKVADPQSDKK